MTLQHLLKPADTERSMSLLLQKWHVHHRLSVSHPTLSLPTPQPFPMDWDIPIQSSPKRKTRDSEPLVDPLQGPVVISKKQRTQPQHDDRYGESVVSSAPFYSSSMLTLVSSKSAPSDTSHEIHTQPQDTEVKDFTGISFNSIF